MFDGRKILIYPYSRDSYALVSFLRSKGHGKENVFLVASGSKGITGRDAGECFNLPPLDITIKNDFRSYMEKADVVFVVESRYNEALITKLKLYIRESLQKEKMVICCSVFEEDFLASLAEETCLGQFVYIPAKRRVVIGDMHDQAENFYRTKAPVVLVGEMIGGLENYDIVEKLTRCFRERGYRVSAVGDKNYSELIEINRLPDMVTALGFSEDAKINLLNMFIRKIEKKEKPDIIILQLPGAIMKYSNKLTESFGIVPFLLSQAVEADYMLLCVPYGMMSIEFYERLKSICLYRFNVELCGICMSNSMLDLQDSDNVSRRSFVNVSQEKVNEKIGIIRQKTDLPIYNCSEEDAFREVCNNLVGLLEG